MALVYTRAMKNSHNFRSVQRLAVLFLFFSVAFSCTADDSDGEEKSGVLYFNPGNATYHGIQDGSVSLKDGLWEGEPYAEGGSSRPRAGLVPDFLVLGDINGDGRQEAVVGLWWSSGGSGTFQYIALLERTETGVKNTFTAPVGDRVRFEGGAIENGALMLDLIEHGPDEPACCPTQAVTRHYDSNLNLESTTPRTTD